MVIDIEPVRLALGEVAEPGRAAAMSSYMRGIAPFLGVTAPRRRAATAQWIRSFDPGPGATALIAAARLLQEQDEREFAYVAYDLADRHRRTLPPGSLGGMRDLALTRPWWDTVDAWSGVIGRAALQPAQRDSGWDGSIARWASQPSLWTRRIAIIFQVGRKDLTNLDLLFEACRQNLADRDFFIRKAIGWALRDAARTHPDDVRAFLRQHSEALSPLSLREATKHLGPV